MQTVSLSITDHFCPIYDTFQIFWVFPKSLKSTVNVAKIIRMSPYLGSKKCRIKIYGKSHQISKKKAVRVLTIWHFWWNSQVKMWIVKVEVTEVNRGWLLINLLVYNEISLLGDNENTFWLEIVGLLHSLRIKLLIPLRDCGPCTMFMTTICITAPL